jgi:SHOCT-like protein
MSDERRRVLDLLAQGKITVDEADQLLRALGANAGAERSTPGGDSAKKPRYIRIAVHKPANSENPAEDINIRVPLPILKGGMRLGALIPGFVGDTIAARLRERGFDCDWSNLDGPAIDAVFAELSEMGINVDSGKAQVRISCE